MSVAKVLDQLEAVLAGLAVPCRGARFSLAVARLGSENHLVTCKVEFSNMQPEPRARVDYGTILLQELWLDLDHALGLVRALAAGSANVGDQVIVRKYDNSFGLRDRKVAPADGISGWSEWAVEFRANDQPNIAALWNPLVKMGLRPYKNGAKAVAEWVWGEDESWIGSLPPRAHEIGIVVPDFRARISSVEWLPNTIRVVGEYGVSHEEVELQAILYSLGRAAQTTAKCPDHNGVVEWSIDSSVIRAEVYVVHSSGDLLWLTDVSNTGTKVRTTGQARTAQEIADRDLTGESDQVEFKPFLVEGDDSAKASEYVKSVVAFSNSAGGRLYIGVRDDGSVEGRGRFLKSAGTGPDRAEDTLKARISKLIADKIKPVPKDYKIDVVQSAGEPILVVNVRQGAERPYATHENEIYIRKGSSNRRPDPRTELPELYPKPSPSPTVRPFIGPYNDRIGPPEDQ